MTAISAEKIRELRERTGVGMSKCKEALVETQGDLSKAIDLLRKKGMASGAKKEGRETREGLVGVAKEGKTIAMVEVNCETDFVAKNEKFKQFVEEIAEQAAETHPNDLQDFLGMSLSGDSSMTIDQYRNVLIQTFGENIQLKKLQLIEKKTDASYGLYSHMGGKIVVLVEISGSEDQEALAKEIAMHIAAESPDYLTPEDIPADVKAKEEEIARSQVEGKPANIVDKIVAGKMNAFYQQICLLLQKFVKDSSISVQHYIDDQGKKIGKPLKVTRFIRWSIGE